MMLTRSSRDESATAASAAFGLAGPVVRPAASDPRRQRHIIVDAVEERADLAVGRPAPADDQEWIERFWPRCRCPTRMLRNKVDGSGRRLYDTGTRSPRRHPAKSAARRSPETQVAAICSSAVNPDQVYGVVDVRTNRHRTTMDRHRRLVHCRAGIAGLIGERCRCREPAAGV